MNQRELNEEIARTTGESMRTISAMGFSLLAGPPPLAVDRRLRLGAFTRRRMKGREASTRKHRPVVKPAKKASASGRVIPFPQIRELAFDLWRA